MGGAKHCRRIVRGGKMVPKILRALKKWPYRGRGTNAFGSKTRGQTKASLPPGGGVGVVREGGNTLIFWSARFCKST